MRYKPGFLGFETRYKKSKKNEKESSIIGVPAAAFAGTGTTA
jgi:hypothetical protein